MNTVTFASCPFFTHLPKTSTPTCCTTTKRQSIVKKLAADLPTQYAAPLAMDWSIYNARITFDDPLTKLSGLFLYKSMIMFLALTVRFCFKDGTAQFLLHSCELTDDERKIRTTFTTRGTTKWGANLVISGEDYFWLDQDDSRGKVTIVRHQSMWDQTSSEIWRSFTTPV